ncbi:pilus assembly protein TadG-related protein [Microbacterium sp.]|uniref:pilus assembly protein TadG-related protein n=1 Tax=Microbacterium sp. TaxID=51671 RepID=UPI003A88DB8B
MDRLMREEDGSVLPLTLGYVLLAIVLILVTVDATSLYLAHKRVEAIADAAALAGSDGFDIAAGAGEPSTRLTDAEVTAQAQAIVDAYGSAWLVAANAPDGTSARATVATTWYAPIMSVFVPEGVSLQATATSRSALR